MKISYVFLLVISLFLFSCRSVKQVTEKKEVPFITENKLLKNIESNKLAYKTLYAKRIDLSLSGKKVSGSFKSSLKIVRDSFIQISVTAPLGIEVARILLTVDSIKFIDLFHKKYFLTDYNYFYNKFDAHIGFDCIQKILTNTFFNFESCSGLEKAKKYKLDRTDNGYELSTLEEKELSRKIKKLYKKKKKNKEYVLILQKILIDPQTFRPLTMSIENMDEETGVGVRYDDYKDFSGRNFPEKIVFKLFTDEDETSLEFKFLRLEFDVPVESNFKILPKYKRMQLY
ncbi:MAG: DUF4292 domain-containing protein [Odoribacter sp.]